MSGQVAGLTASHTAADCTSSTMTVPTPEGLIALTECLSNASILTRPNDIHTFLSQYTAEAVRYRDLHNERNPTVAVYDHHKPFCNVHVQKQLEKKQQAEPTISKVVKERPKPLQKITKHWSKSHNDNSEVKVQPPKPSVLGQSETKPTRIPPVSSVTDPSLPKKTNVSNNAQLDTSRSTHAPLNTKRLPVAPKQGTAKPSESASENTKPTGSVTNPSLPKTAAPTKTQLEPQRPTCAPLNTKSLPTYTLQAHESAQTETTPSNVHKVAQLDPSHPTRGPLNAKHLPIASKPSENAPKESKPLNVQVLPMSSVTDPSSTPSKAQVVSRRPICAPQNTKRLPVASKKDTVKPASAPSSVYKQISDCRTFATRPLKTQKSQPSGQKGTVKVGQKDRANTATEGHLKPYADSAAVYTLKPSATPQSSHKNIAHKQAKQKGSPVCENNAVSAQGNVPINESTDTTTSTTAKATSKSSAPFTEAGTHKRVTWAEWGRTRSLLKTDDTSASIPHSTSTLGPVTVDNFERPQIFASSYTCPHFAHTVHIIRYRRLAKPY